MKYTRKYLQNLLKEHNLKGYSHYDTKPELIELLVSKGILNEQDQDDVIPKDEKQAKNNTKKITEKSIDSRNRNPQCIRRPPKQVKVTNLETGEITVFPSMYKCGKTLKINTGSLKWHNNKQIANYLIEIAV